MTETVEVEATPRTRWPLVLAALLGSALALVVLTWAVTRLSHVSTASAFAITGVGVVAGAVGAVVGFGTAITIPLLIAFGLPPITASVTTTVGLVPGSISGAVSYRRELAGQGRRLRRFGLAIGLGAVVGASVLLVAPAAVFAALIPALIVVSVLMVIFPARVKAILARVFATELGDATGEGFGALVTVFVVGVYGGYYSGALGLVVLAMLSVLLPEVLERLNAAKVTLVAVTNSVSAVEFVVLGFLGVAHIDWPVVVLLAVGSTVGGAAGPWMSRNLSTTALRWVIVVIALGALVKDLT